MENTNTIDWFNTNSDMFNTLIQLSEQPQTPVQPLPCDPALSIIQSDNQFVNIASGKPFVTKTSDTKKRFKEPVFVTESPEKAYKKKNDNSSSDSEDESPGSNPKRLTSKEKRQLRNKISARNFRVRRKEYITQLEQKLEEQDKFIKELQEENEKLRALNDGLMQQIISQPPLHTTIDEPISSSSEGQSSPEGLSNLPFQFPMDVLYDLSIFDQPEQSTFNPESFDSFFFNHALMPDFDLHRIISDKIKPSMNKDEKREATEELLSEYPLLGAALMSIVLRHTMSLDYVASMSNEIVKSKVKEDETKESSQQPQLLIEPPYEIDKDELSTITDEEIMNYVLTYYYKNYAFARARGLGHKAIVDDWRECIEKHKTKDFFKKMRNKDISEKYTDSKPSKAQTFQAYFKVAGALLKRPQRMAHINKVLKETIQFSQNEHTQRIEQQYVSMMNHTSKLRISTN